MNLPKPEKHKSNLYTLRVTDKNGVVSDVLSSHNYEGLMLEAMELSKERGGTWVILNAYGKEVDGGIDHSKKRRK